MITATEKIFFAKFKIPPTVRVWEQYNYAQAKRGLEIFPEREKLAKQGFIKITCKMLNPRPENDCVYWEEMHYTEITAEGRERLEDVLCGPDNLHSIAFCKDDNSYTYSLWEDDIILCNGTGKSRKDALLDLINNFECIDEIENEIIKIVIGERVFERLFKKKDETLPEEVESSELISADELPF